MENEKHNDMEENNEEEKGFKNKTKNFFSKHKNLIIGTVSVAVLLSVVALLSRKGYGPRKKNYKDEDIYDWLLQKREEIRLNTQSKTWESDLSKIDMAINSIPNPRREFSKTLSDDELESFIQSSRSVWESAQKELEKKTKDMSYRDYYKDPEHLRVKKLHDTFYQALLEKQHRYAEANPDKFPIHREHGWYLPNED